MSHNFLENLYTPGLMVYRGTFAVCCDSYTGCTSKQRDRMQGPIMLRRRKCKGIPSFTTFSIVYSPPLWC